VLQKMYDSDMLTYCKQIMTYEQSITSEQRKMIKEEIERVKSTDGKLELKKKCVELGRPKRPPTGFLQFVTENKYIRREGQRPTEMIRTLADKWKVMSEEEKEKYKLESQKLMEQYKQDMKEWEENMVRKGHIDVVRNRGLIDLKVNNLKNAE